jgi:hypothetical protein
LFREKVLFGENLIYKELILQLIEGWRFQKNRLTEEFDLETLKYNNKGKLKPFMRIQINGELDMDFSKTRVVLF